MKRQPMRGVLAVALLGLLPALAAAQQSAGSIAGQARDTSGAVLPGVTVEVSSPALIEKTRTVVTDGNGAYQVVGLPPGLYTVVFTLPGFSTAKHEGIELTTGFTATVNTALAIGSVQETVTVSGAAPAVDVQNVLTQKVMTREVMDVLPTSRYVAALAQLLPGMTVSTSPDTGGSEGPNRPALAIHGSNGTDMMLNFDGMPMLNGVANGVVSQYNPPNGMLEETVLLTDAHPAEVELGGVVVNWVPKSGGNAFHGGFIADFSDNALQSDNLPESVKRQPPLGLGATPPALGLHRSWELNPHLGGPIVQDRVWFYVAGVKQYAAWNTILYPDRDPSDFSYDPDTSRAPQVDEGPAWDVSGKVTVQASLRNKFNVLVGIHETLEPQHYMSTPEGAAHVRWPTELVQGTWQSPATSRLLLEAGGMAQRQRYIVRAQTDDRRTPTPSRAPAAIELATGRTLRKPLSGALFLTEPTDFTYRTFYGRGSVSYVTGSHAFKVGGDLLYYKTDSVFGVPLDGLNYNVLLLAGRPVSVQFTPNPAAGTTLMHKTALYAQDQWKIANLTANLGLRLDTHWEGYPDTHLVATQYTQARDFPAADLVRWKDLNPRVGIAYDLFGNGKTALKATAGRFVNKEYGQIAEYAAPAIAGNPSLTRAWNDINGDFIPQGDPLNPLANGELGPTTNANFGRPGPIFTTARDPEWAFAGLNEGRDYHWQFSASVQHELTPGVAVTGGYYRRHFGNHWVADNRALTAADFTQYCATTPTHPSLPGGGGNQVCGYHDVIPAKVAAVQNVFTNSETLGGIKQTYNGFDLTMNARWQALLLQGGMSTGKQSLNICSAARNAPELLSNLTPVGSSLVRLSIPGNLPLDYCDMERPWLSQVKFFGAYDFPWQLQVSASYVDEPSERGGYYALPSGVTAAATYTNAQLQSVSTLGRTLSTGPTGSANLTTVRPGSLFLFPRLRQVDLRVSRSFTAGGTRMRVNVDLYNLLNGSTVISYQGTYGGYASGGAGRGGLGFLTPTLIQQGRYAKFGVQVSF